MGPISFINATDLTTERNGRVKRKKGFNSLGITNIVELRAHKGGPIHYELTFYADKYRGERKEFDKIICKWYGQIISC